TSPTRPTSRWRATSPRATARPWPRPSRTQRSTRAATAGGAMAVQTADPRSGPRLADGTELIGEFEGSGFKEPPSLARRGSGQVIQLTPLLYSVAEKADGQRDLAQIAQEVGDEIGRTVTADNVRTLVDNKLRPLGILTGADVTQPEVKKLDPLLALKFRVAVIPESASRVLGNVFRPLFFPPLILAA